MSNLKPCPFCGGEAEEASFDYNYTYDEDDGMDFIRDEFIECIKCGARAETPEKWNSRVPNLLPCPICKKSAILVQTEFWEEAVYFVSCTSCPARTYGHADDDLAVMEWNMRVLKEKD